ncbi:hypothetical protein [Lentibacillus cibarius]|uniref:DUF1404 domain-containing protein n=1 Tax=Lentibacillus cibarius TaxID=2583219 RepID=A0A5S3QHL2_9BACI|nr:hypothetical protein [Lentibacillus cibarius]TMN21338.1 hypothetical protein FFL34_03870 [Lentibacillus cibarius]
MRKNTYGLILFVILVVPPIRNLMESIMIVHMLIQIPLLIVAGWLLAGYAHDWFKNFLETWNGNGIPGMLLVVFVITYWLIPRTLDASLESWLIELFKFISLPFLVGIPLRDSWGKIGSLVKSFIIFNFIPMFGLMAWLYIDAPVRVCNNYLEVEQKVLGWGFLVITASCILYMLQYVFTDHSDTTP